MPRRSILYFFVDLVEGDPVALTVLGVLLALAAIFCLIWWKIARDLRREDEEKKNRYKPKGGTKQK